MLRKQIGYIRQRLGRTKTRLDTLAALLADTQNQIPPPKRRNEETAFLLVSSLSDSIYRYDVAISSLQAQRDLVVKLRNEVQPMTTFTKQPVGTALGGAQ